MVFKKQVWRDISTWFIAWSSMFSIGLLFVLFMAFSLAGAYSPGQGGIPTGAGFLNEIWTGLYRVTRISYQVVLGALAAVTLISLAINSIFWFWRGSKPAQALYWLFYDSRSWIAMLGFCLSLVYILKLPFVRFLPGDDPDVATVAFTALDALSLAALGYLFAGLALARPLQTPWLEEWTQKLRGWRERTSESLNRLPPFWSRLAVSLLPVVLVFAVVYGAWGSRFSNYLPTFWNDAVGYWLWSRQFAFHGFGGGYNYPNELTPPWAFNHFGEGSPLYVYVYGTFGRLLGWQAHLPILVNLLLLGLSLWVFSHRARLNTIQNLILGCALAVSWPIWLFLLTASHETLNQALGTILALGFLFFLQKKPISTASKVGWLLLGIFAGLTRLSWVLLLYPLLFFIFSGSLLRRALLALATWIPLVAAIVYVTRQLIPPIQNSIFTILGSTNASGVETLVRQFFIQVRFLLKYQDMGPSLLVVFLMLILGGAGIGTIVRQRRAGVAWGEIFHTQEAFDIYNMLALLAAGMTLYLAQGFYRVFFAALWVSLLLHIAQKRYAYVKLFVVMSLFFAPLTLNYYGDWDGTKKNYTLEWPEVRQSQPAIAESVAFDETAENPWCNTILIPVMLYDGRLTILPPGIGISYIASFPLPNRSVQSKYLLLDQGTYDILTRDYHLRAERLASLPVGDLYQNLEADCLPSR